jgi:hypothetical protein
MIQMPPFGLGVFLVTSVSRWLIDSVVFYICGGGGGGAAPLVFCT